MQIILIGEAPGKNWKPSDVPLLGRIGKRLAILMGTNEYNYRWHTRRENLLQRWPGPARGNGSAWNAKLAARAAARMERKGILGMPDSIVILLGRRVARAFRFHESPWFKEWPQANGATIVVAPHPSGASRWWNDPRNWNEACRFWRGIYARATE